jgi:hypothetical protein
MERADKQSLCADGDAAASGLGQKTIVHSGGTEESMEILQPELLRLPNGLFLVSFLQNEKCLLLLALFGDQPFAVVIVLHTRQKPSRGTKVHQNPWCHAAQLRNAVQHAQLMLKYTRLKLLVPSL